MRRAVLRFCAASVLALSTLSVAAEERVSLLPARAPAWSSARLLDSLRDGARKPRELRIATVPADAELELTYLRDGAQLARALGTAPLLALVPGSALTDARDRIIVRAQREGFLSREVALDAQRAPPSLRVELAPRPRVLLAASLLELGAYSRLALLSDQQIEARLTRTESGWRLALADVAYDAQLAGRLGTIRGAAVERVAVTVVGRDLLLDLTAGPRERGEPRLVRRSEAVRKASQLALEWLPEDRGVATYARAESALGALDRARLGACCDAFERALADSLGLETLARSLSPSGGFTDRYVALAIELIAAKSPGGEIVMRDGPRVRLDGRLARARVLSQAADARGVLLAVRALAEALAPAGDAQRALHAWLAPELAPNEFAAAYANADAAEAHCRARP